MIFTNIKVKCGKYKIAKVKKIKHKSKDTKGAQIVKTFLWKGTINATYK